MRKIKLFFAVLTISVMSCGMIVSAAEPVASTVTQAPAVKSEDTRIHGLGTFVKTKKSVIVDGHVAAGFHK